MGHFVHSVPDWLHQDFFGTVFPAGYPMMYDFCTHVGAILHVDFLHTFHAIFLQRFSPSRIFTLEDIFLLEKISLARGRKNRKNFICRLALEKIFNLPVVQKYILGDGFNPGYPHMYEKNYMYEK